MSDLVKIWFALDRDEFGWPPAQSEGLWARAVEPGRFRLDNAPWFVRGVAADDVVEAEPDGAGVWWFRRLVVRGGPRDPSTRRAAGRSQTGRPRRLLGSLGVTGEGMASPVNLVALDIGPEVTIASVKALLNSGETDGRWDYEEGCVTDDWLRLT